MIKSADEFLGLRKSKIPEEYGRAANDCASDEVWIDIISRYPEMKVWVVHNKTVSINILNHLADDPDPDVRCAVAEKRKAGEEILCKLAEDNEESVRLAVVYNPTIPKNVLIQLINDVSEGVASTAKRKLKEQLEADQMALKIKINTNNENRK